MKEIIIKVTVDDSDGYKGHGDDIKELILNGLKTYLEYDLEQDSVIKPNWSVEILK